MKIEPCKHEGKHTLGVVDGLHHLYCSRCGWHLYKGIEYTKNEWYLKFQKE